MIENLQNKTANEIRDLAVADINLLSESLKELKQYQLKAVGKTLAIPRYTVLSREELLVAIMQDLSGEQSEFSEALVPMKQMLPAAIEVPSVTFQLLTNTSLKEYTYPGNVSMRDVLKDLGLGNKSVAIKGELIPARRLENTLLQLEVDGSIVAAITKTANA